MKKGYHSPFFRQMSVDIIDPYINYGKLPLDDSEDSPRVGINIQEDDLNNLNS